MMGLGQGGNSEVVEVSVDLRSVCEEELTGGLNMGNEKEGGSKGDP